MTSSSDTERWLAFSGTTLLAEGDLRAVATAAKEAIDRGDAPAVQFFDAETSRQIDLDLRGDLERVLSLLDRGDPPPDEAAPKRRGRPRLGVVAREVTLLPRHWDWLSQQPGGASVALRKLVEIARRGDEGAIRSRGARDRVYRFMSPVAGDLPGFEEASRALFAGKGEKFKSLIADWPDDVRRQLERLSAGVFDST